MILTFTETRRDTPLFCVSSLLSRAANRSAYGVLSKVRSGYDLYVHIKAEILNVTFGLNHINMHGLVWETLKTLHW